MIEFADGTVVAVSRRLLRDRVTHGIYWILANGLPGHERQAFTNSFGPVFEEYIRRCFLRALGRKFAARPVYGPERLPVVDGVLVTTRSLGLPECKGMRLLLSVREVGTEEELRRLVGPALERAAGQLAAAIGAGERGEMAGIPTTEETKYYPMVITYEALPMHPLAVGVYEGVVHPEGRLKGKNIKPVTFLSVRDAENMEALILAGEAWPDLLTRKHTEKYQRLPFHNYVYDRFEGRLPRNRYVRARWDRIGNMIRVRCFGEPLRGGKEGGRDDGQQPRAQDRRVRNWRGGAHSEGASRGLW